MDWSKPSDKVSKSLLGGQGSGAVGLEANHTVDGQNPA